MPRNQITRRVFLAASTALTAVSLSGCGGMAVYQSQVRGGRISVAVKDFPELSQAGGGIALKAPDLAGSVILIHLDGRTFQAFSSVCTHLGCHVRLSGRFLTCPCHGSTYDLDGQVLRGPAQRALRRFETQETDGRVEILVRE